MERSLLHIAKVTGSAVSKLSKVRVVGKSIARVLSLIILKRETSENTTRARSTSRWTCHLRRLETCPLAHQAGRGAENQEAAAEGVAVPTSRVRSQGLRQQPQQSAELPARKKKIVEQGFSFSFSSSLPSPLLPVYSYVGVNFLHLVRASVLSIVHCVWVFYFIDIHPFSSA